MTDLAFQRLYFSRGSTSISLNDTIATQTINQMNFRDSCAGLNVTLHSASPTFTWKFKITRCDWVLVGLCDQLLLETHYLGLGYDFLTKGHGFYGFDNNKEVYHSNEEPSRTGIIFDRGDIVELIFDPERKTLTVTNQTYKQTSKKTSKMMIPCDSPLVPVALLNTKGNSVEVIN